jgi:hypothetical protein
MCPSDDSCIEILSNVRRAMNPGARVFIVEMMFADQGAPGHDDAHVPYRART